MKTNERIVEALCESLDKKEALIEKLKKELDHKEGVFSKTKEFIGSQDEEFIKSYVRRVFKDLPDQRERQSLESYKKENKELYCIVEFISLCGNYDISEMPEIKGLGSNL